MGKVPTTSAAFDLLVHPFEGVRRPDLPPVLLREAAEREDVVLRLFEQTCDLRMRPCEHAPDLVELAQDVLGVGLGKIVRMIDATFGPAVFGTAVSTFRMKWVRQTPTVTWMCAGGPVCGRADTAARDPGGAE